MNVMKVVQDLPSCSFLTAATTTRSETWFVPAEQKSEVGFRTTDAAAVMAEPLKPRSLWETTSPPQQEQVWKAAFEARQHQDAGHFGLPQFVFVRAWQLGQGDDDDVSDLNSEADFEDEDCLPEATIQVLEAVFGVVPLDDDDEDDEDEVAVEDEHGYTADKELSLSSADISSSRSSSFSFILAPLDTSPLPAVDGDQHHSESTETERVHLPNATFQVVKSLFASLDDLDTSTTSYASTYVDSRSSVTVHQTVSATTPALLLTHVTESIAHSGCEFIIPHPKLTSNVG